MPSENTTTDHGTAPVTVDHQGSEATAFAAWRVLEHFADQADADVLDSVRERLPIALRDFPALAHETVNVGVLYENADAVDEETLSEYATHDACNEFAFWYVENVNDNAVVKDGLAFGRTEHCYVYDPDDDVTIDATCGQFEDAPVAGAWDGDNNPVIDGRDEVYEWSDRSEFEEHYGAHPNSPFIL